MQVSASDSAASLRLSSVPFCFLWPFVDIIHSASTANSPWVKQSIVDYFTNNTMCVVKTPMWYCLLVFLQLLSGMISVRTDLKYASLKNVKTTHSDFICVPLHVLFFVSSFLLLRLPVNTHIWNLACAHTTNTCGCEFPQGHWGWSPSKVNKKHNTWPTAISVNFG